MTQRFDKKQVIRQMNNVKVQITPATDLYAELRQSCLPRNLSLREPADFHDPIPISERLVQAIWCDQLFDEHILRTRDGKLLKVIHPGRWNVEGGPDFTGAHLQIAERSIRGDVEIHLHTTGWNSHRHHENPAYNRVILDVCLWDLGGPAVVRTADGAVLPQLVLHPCLQCSLEELVESLDFDRYPFGPTRNARPSPLAHLPKERMADYLESAGTFRFEQKVTRISAGITQHGAEQAAYSFLAEALGYKHNKLAFQQIATALPLVELLKRPMVDRKIEALLTESARFRLRISQVRPANHPHRRLAALAVIADAHPKLEEWFGDLVEQPEKLQTPPRCVHPFWSWHYNHHGKRLTKPCSLLGRDRWKEIVCNVILPFCSANARLRGNTGLMEKALQRYIQFPASQSNLAARHIARDLQVSLPRRMLQQQGLIQIYQDFDLLLPDVL